MGAQSLAPVFTASEVTHFYTTPANTFEELLHVIDAHAPILGRVLFVVSKRKEAIPEMER